MVKYIDLRECYNKEVSEVGGKAKWIGKLNKVQGINVPRGICIPTEYYKKFLLNHKYSKEIEELIEDSIKTPINSRKNLSKVRNLLKYKSVLDDEFINNILEDLKSLNINIEDGIVVRSSSQCEDNSVKSYAGIFTSTVDVCNVKQLKTAIIDTWASQFSELLFTYDTTKSRSLMAIVIQEMIKAENYGVLFSKAPMDKKYMLLESGKSVSQIVDGLSPNNTFFVDRKTKEIVDCTNKKITDYYKKLINNTVLIENTFNMYCDIEWAIDEGKTYILQCRPITFIDSKFDYKIIEQDDVSHCENLYLGPCEKYLNNFVGKQYLFRKEVINNGFNVYKQIFLIINKRDALDKAIEECINYFKECKFVIIEFGDKKKTVTCKLRDIYNVLHNEIKDEFKPIYCRIGELIDADKSGYACINDNCECLIEYVLGRMNNIQNGKEEPIKVLIKDNKATYISKPVIKSISTIDKNTGKKINIKFNGEYPYLKQNEISNLESFTKKMSKTFKSSSFEWYISGDKLFGKDISVESNTLAYKKEMKNIISKGCARGIVYKIDELDLLDEIAEKYELSLYAHDEDDYLVLNNPEVNKIIKELKKYNKPIVFAKRPTNGILAFANLIGGCVFKYGSVLSHIGICMREKHIPSCINKELYDNVQNKQSIVELKDGLVSILEK